MLFKILLCLALLSAVMAQPAMAGYGSITLLATSTSSEKGVLAEVHLETRPGTGRIFIESSLISKIDTQISTKFANEIACDYLDSEKCEELDFFYTIDSTAKIIGGPSAGAAITALTISVLERFEINESVTITGTINSGGIIGNVGGITKKIDAAEEKGIKKVLIPRGSPDNATDYGAKKGIEVIEVFGIDEAVKEITGEQIGPEKREINIIPEYSEVMNKLAQDLCARSEELKKEAYESYRDKEEEIFKKTIKEAKNLSDKSKEALSKNNSYAAASFCFGSNIKHHHLILIASDFSNQEIYEGIEQLEKKINETEILKENATTISDFQTSGIVGNRLEDARAKLRNSIKLLEEGNITESLFQLAYGYERYETAVSWSKFFGFTENEREISQEVIKTACETKAREAVEIVEYARVLMKQGNYKNDEIARIENLSDSEEYAGCLYESMLLKSDTNFILNSFEGTEIEEIVGGKIEAAGVIISRQNQKNLFPIVGYSYYEYAKTLENEDPISALKFAEYALEFSHLDHYLREQNPLKKNIGRIRGNYIDIEYFLGVFTGVSILLFGISRTLKCRCSTRTKKSWSRIKRRPLKK